MHRQLTVACVFSLFVGLASPARAGVCDLTTAGTTCDSFGAVFSRLVPPDTFAIDPFLQLTTPGGRTSTTTVEQGFNATGLSVESVPVLEINGSTYWEFMLQIDEPGWDREITLDQLQIFLSPSSSMSGSTTSVSSLAGLLQVYNLDSAGDNNVKLSIAVSPGMVLYVPTIPLEQATGQYLYLFSQFGTTTAANGGMEEWWVRNPAVATYALTPEPGTLLLFGSALAGLGWRHRRRRARQA